MTGDKNPSYFTTFFIDSIIVIFSVLATIVITTIFCISLTGSRKEGMAYGLIIGFVLGLSIFYYFRGQFNFIWTLIQTIANAALTFGEFFCVAFLLKDTEIAEISYGYLLIFVSFPALITVNKQILDQLASKINGQRRKKKPFRVL